MSDTTTPAVEPEVERARPAARLFNVNAGPGLLADAMKSDEPAEGSAVSSVADGED